MGRFLKFSGTTLMLVLAWQLAGDGSSNFLGVNDIAAGGLRGRLRHLDTAAEAQTTTQSSGAEAGTEIVASEEWQPPDNQRPRRKGRHRSQDKSPDNTKTKTASAEKKEQAPAAVSTEDTLPIGTVVGRLPGDCQAEVVSRVSYSNCGGTYYRAAFQGSNLVYVVVDNPQP